MKFVLIVDHLTNFYVGVWVDKFENFLKTPQAADQALETELGQKIFTAFQPEKYRGILHVKSKQIIHF